MTSRLVTSSAKFSPEVMIWASVPGLYLTGFLNSLCLKLFTHKPGSLPIFNSMPMNG